MLGGVGPSLTILNKSGPPPSWDRFCAHTHTHTHTHRLMVITLSVWSRPFGTTHLKTWRKIVPFTCIPFPTAAPPRGSLLPGSAPASLVSAFRERRHVTVESGNATQEKRFRQIHTDQHAWQTRTHQHVVQSEPDEDMNALYLGSVEL